MADGIAEELKELITRQKEYHGNIKSDFQRLQTQVDGIDAKISTRHRTGEPGPENKTIGELVVEHAKFREAKESGFRGQDRITIPIDGPFFPIGRKTNITDATLGNGSTGVLMPQRIPGVVGLAQQGFRIRDVLTVRPQTTGNSFDWLRQTVRTNNASPQVEAASKGESTYLWDTQSGTIRTYAHFTNCSRQALDDNSWLQATIDNELRYGLELKVESEILAGDGLGIHLSGLITQGTAYNTSMNISGDTKLDILRHAKLQARLAGLATFSPDFFVLHPTDLEKIELIKVDQSAANTGLYILGDPRTGARLPFIWGIPVVESDSMSAGQFLVGSGNAAEIVDRMQTTVDISYEHGSNFTSNLVTIRAESRLGLAVKRPNAFIFGSY